MKDLEKERKTIIKKVDEYEIHLAGDNTYYTRKKKQIK